MKTITGLFMAAAALSGCGSSTPEPAAATAVLGTWEATAPEGAHLTLESDASLRGSDGCNSFFGTWSREDTRLVFEDVAKTEMYCAGVDDWLSHLDTATVQDAGGRMHILDAHGQWRGSVDKLPRSRP